MTDDRHCQCEMFGEHALDGHKPCHAPPTQEDLLCDPCRLQKVMLKELSERKRQSAGVHCSGNSRNGNKHTHFSDSKPGASFEGFYLLDEEVVSVAGWGVGDHEPHARA